MPELIKGYATAEATKAYVEQHQGQMGEGHYSDFLKTRIRLSSIGVGTFPGEASLETDAEVSRLVQEALQQGINVVDTAAHYRYGRALAAVGAGVRAAVESGVPREAMFLISKGGFLTFRGGLPQDINQWIAQEIEAKGVGSKEDVTRGAHCISPAYIMSQLELSRSLMGVETLDAFLIDQPEIHISEIGKEALNRKLLPVFVELEKAVMEGKLRYYGISTYEGFRVETDAPQFQSLTSLLGLAEKAAQEATGKPGAPHHFAVVQLPFNQAMTEGFTRFSHATGQGNIAPTLQAAFQLKVYVMASHTLLKGHLAQQCTDVVHQVLPLLKNHAQRAIQFNRSTPGLGTTLVGLSKLAHLSDALAVAKFPPLSKENYVKMYQRTE